MPELPELLPVVRNVLGTILGWILGQTSSPNLSGLAAAINTVWEGLRVTTSEFIRVRYWDKAIADDIGNFTNDIGGAVETIGQNQHDLFHNLRYVLMPNTIQSLWDQTFSKLISPLRLHLWLMIGWIRGWFAFGQRYTDSLYSWSHDIIAAQRAWRAKYVYPQLQWLMSPQRVAYHYVQSFLTEMVQYLAYAGHTGDRDGIARAVIDTSPRLWRHTEQAILMFLEQPIDSSGRGSPLPQRPSWATQPPPLVPPIWEAWITQPPHGAWPDFNPHIPEQEANYFNSKPPVN